MLARSQEQAAKFERMLVEKDREITELRLAAGKGCFWTRCVLYLKSLLVHAAGAGPSSGLPPTISEHDLKQAYCNSVQSLKDYIALSNLLTFDISGEFNIGTNQLHGNMPFP